MNIKIAEEAGAVGATPTEGNNPFRKSGGDIATIEQDNTSLEVVESRRQMAEVQASMAIAKRFPRDEELATNRILNACKRITLAEQAVYTFPRGGQQVSGPSIRLAEAIAQNWGNINFGIRELGQHGDRSSVLAYSWDLETNTRCEKIFEVPHTRHTKNGDYKLTDPRDIYETVANQGSRRLRACILSVIPGDVIDAALTEIDHTLTNRPGTIEERVNKMLEVFLGYQIVAAHIEKKIGHSLKSITPTELKNLSGIYNSIRDGYSKPEDHFDTGKKKGNGRITGESEE